MLLGMLLTWAVAVACAVFSPCSWEEVGDRELLLSREGMDTQARLSDFPSDWVPPHATSGTQLAEKRRILSIQAWHAEGFGLLANATELHQVRVGVLPSAPARPIALVIRHQVGWPMRYLTCALKLRAPTGPIDSPNWSRGIPMNHRWVADVHMGEFVYERPIPWSPAVVPMLVNWTLFSVSICLLVQTFVSARGQLRNRRGRCPRCAYSLRSGNRCPECGFAVSARRSTSWQRSARV